jgi:hypothetical protein
MLLTPDAELRGINTLQLVDDLLERVPAPVPVRTAGP